MDYVNAVCEEYHVGDAGDKLFHYSDDRKFATRWRSFHRPIRAGHSILGLAMMVTS